MKELIARLEAGQDLGSAEIRAGAEALLDESVSTEVKARFLEVLAQKGESPAEIAAFVSVFLEHAVDPDIASLELVGPTVDVCGTGGDRLDLFNVSTTAMFPVAAAGAKVIKHGNRGITSKSGGADVLEALGVVIELPPRGVRHCLREAGVGFLFAPAYHPAFRAVVPARRALAERGVRTLFNLIGPLLNPASPSCQLLGIFADEWGPSFAEILHQLGRESAWVVHGRTGDGRSVDELSLMGPTQIHQVGARHERRSWRVRPADLGLREVDVAELQGGDAVTNARILEGILQGTETGPKRDMVLLNAGAAIVVSGLAETLPDGIQRAREVLDDGSALERLRRLQAASVAAQSGADHP